MNIKKHIPNTITCLNLLAGSVAVICATECSYYGVVVCVALAAVCDFCDGFAARLLKAYSPLGKELDSLADLVSFGLAPALLLLNLLMSSLPHPLAYLSFAALLIPVFAALRLAKFNVDDRQTHSFIGLPVPANALWWLGVCHLFVGRLAPLPLWVLLCIVVAIFLTAYLMVSEIPMFSLKFTNYSWRPNALRYSLLICAALFIALMGIAGLAPTIALYVLLSLWQNSRARHA